MFSTLILVGVALCGADADAAPQSNIIVRGRVVDAEGRPVAKAIVGTVWTPMGWYDKDGKRWALDGPNIPKDESRWTQEDMQPTSVQNGVLTDEKGEFIFPVRPGDSAMLAFDQKRENSGLVDCDLQRLTEPLVIRLVPAIEVTGRMIVKSTGKPADWSIVCVYLADQPADPLAGRRFLMCWALDGCFKFKLPPGNYEFEAYSDPASLRNAETIIALKGDKLQVNVGELALVPGEPTRDERIELAKKENRVVEVKELLGKPLPQWHVTDARGIDPNAGIEQFKGRWTLIYFWHMHCRPCAGKEVARLTKFVAEHDPISEKIAVISFVIGAKSWKTMTDADKYLEPIAKRYWAEPWTRLPQAFDKTDRTRESIAEELFGQWILLDPKGIVAATGDDTSVGLDTLKDQAGI